MLWLSEILLKNSNAESFEDLMRLVEDGAQKGEIFFRMDVKPPFNDTPEDWEDLLESAFSGVKN